MRDVVSFCLDRDEFIHDQNNVQVDERLIKSFFAGQAVGANILGRGTGLAINNNVEVLNHGLDSSKHGNSYKFKAEETDPSE